MVVWSSRCKFFWNALDPVIVIFFIKNIYVGKITSPEIIVSELVIFITKIFFAKKLQWPDQVHFKKRLQQLDQTTTCNLFVIFWKNYNDWIKGKLPIDCCSKFATEWVNHFGKSTDWSLIYFLIYAYLNILAQSQILSNSL